MNSTELQQLLATRPLVLDGGLATELERGGHSLNDSLWSARLLSDSPQDIYETHLRFLNAGANIITSCSYQATVDGFINKLGLDTSGAESLIAESVELAQRARREFRTLVEDQSTYVAAGIGPYGAFLADGSEYTGNYDLSANELLGFHKPRWQILTAQTPDLVLCETIPQREELIALGQLADGSDVSVIISMSCKDAQHLRDGTPLIECVRILQQHNVGAVGINCVSPEIAIEAIGRLSEQSSLPLIAYPNSGEAYSAERKQWSGEKDVGDFEVVAKALMSEGCRIVGGCCRTTPKDIAAISRALNMPQ